MYNLLSRNYKYRFVNKVASHPLPKKEDLEDAIQHADIYGDQGWVIEDFDIEFLGYLTTDEISQYDDFSSWIDVEPNEELDESFRGSEWLHRSQQWNEANTPPVIVISAPVVSENELYTQIGDGRGRINFAVSKGIKLPVYHMKWKNL